MGGWGPVAQAIFFVLVLLSNVMFFGFLSFTRLGGMYYDAASRVQSRASVWGHWEWFRSSAKRERRFAYPEGAAEKAARIALPWIARDTRALLVKDTRMFWRDTTQWGQSVLLFGLLGVYVINLRHFTSQLTNPFWIHLVSYLNLGACSLNLATLTTRFVYPQFSLEGRRLWIVGMAPMGLMRVVKAKYWLASCASLVVTLSLVILSSCLLKMTWDRVAFFGAVIAVMIVHPERTAACQPGGALSQLQGKQPDQNRERVWRHVLSRAEFFVHPRFDFAAGIWLGGNPGQFNRANRGGHQHLRICFVFTGLGLVAAQVCAATPAAF